MNELNIQLADERTAFQPGEEIAGTASWRLDQPARSVELRLFWFTRGKGTEDAAIVETLRFDAPAQQAAEPFRFKLPDAPYSFSGKLISLIWSLELIALPAKQVQRREIIVAPGGREVLLEQVPDLQPEKRSRFRMRIRK